MKKSVPYVILIAEALICICLVSTSLLPSSALPVLTAFPFEQIGGALRALSLSGSVGNLIAIVLYIAFCLSPCAFLVFRKPRRFSPEDVLLLLLCAVLFFVLYQMINPGAITIVGGFASGLPIAKAVLGGTVYSVLLGYLVLRALRVFRDSAVSRTSHYLCVLLFLLNIVFVAVIFGSHLQESITSAQTMQLTNSANAHLFPVNLFFIGLSFFVRSLPYALNIWIVFAAISLLRSLQEDRYSDATIACAKKLSRSCIITLAAIVCSSVAFNLLQIPLGSVLFSVAATLQIPLFSIAFVLVCLLFTRFITESKALKDDNDSII